METSSEVIILIYGYLYYVEFIGKILMMQLQNVRRRHNDSKFLNGYSVILDIARHNWKLHSNSISIKSSE